MNSLALNKREFLIKWSFFLLGLLLAAFGLTLTIKARDLGISPWEVFHYGLYLKYGLSIGTWSIIIGVLIVSLSTIWTKTMPKMGTYLNMVLVGIFIDFFNWILPEVDTLWIEIVLLLLGIIITALGVGLYVAPDVGAGPRDSVMLGVSKKWGFKVSHVRNAIEFTVFLLGWMLGGPVGVGTVLIVLTLGTVVGYTIPFSDKLLNFIIRRGETHEDFNQGTLRINHYD